MLAMNRATMHPLSTRSVRDRLSPPSASPTQNSSMPKGRKSPRSFDGPSKRRCEDAQGPNHQRQPYPVPDPHGAKCARNSSCVVAERPHLPRTVNSRNCRVECVRQVGQVASQGMPMRAVTINDLASDLVAGAPKAPFAMSRMAQLNENLHRTGLTGCWTIPEPGLPNPLPLFTPRSPMGRVTPRSVHVEVVALEVALVVVP